jgi:hypothetical protein
MIPWLCGCLAALHALLYPQEPHAAFIDIAHVIDDAAHATPLGGDDGLVEMAAELAVLAATEGHLRREAEATDQWGRSASYFQVHESNAARLGLTYIDLFDPEKTAHAAAVLVFESHRVCAHFSPDSALAEYATGRGRCDEPLGVKLSRIRMGLARWLLQTHTPYWMEVGRDEGVHVRSMR